MEITEKEKNKLLAAAEIVQNGDFAVIEKIIEFGNSLDEKETTLTSLIQEVRQTLENFTEKASGMMNEKMDSLKDGENYVLTDQDKKDIARSVVVPVVEKVVERTEVVREIPIETVKVTNEIKEVAIPETAEQERDKLESLVGDERLDVSAIKGLEGLEKKILKQIVVPHGGARSNNATKFYPLTADGSTKIFTVPKGVAGIVLCSDFPTVLMEGNGFTINATRTQITLTTDNAPSLGAQLLYQYSSMFNS